MVPRLARAFAIEAGCDCSTTYFDVAHAVLVYDITIASPIVSTPTLVQYLFGSNSVSSIRNAYLVNKG